MYIARFRLLKKKEEEKGERNLQACKNWHILVCQKYIYNNENKEDEGKNNYSFESKNLITPFIKQNNI